MVSKACYVASYRRKLEELAAMPGVELTLLVPPYWRHGASKAPLEPGFDRGYRTVVENPLFNGNFHLHFYRRLPQLIRSFRPHLVHIDEEPYDYVTFHALRASRGVAPRVLFFTWQNIHRKYAFPFGWFEQNVLNGVHGAIAGNQEGARILRNKGYARPLYVIPQFGIDPELFYPRTEDLSETFNSEQPFRVGYSGRLVEEKGLLVLLRALAGLDGPWELRILGEGPLRHRLAEEAAALGTGQHLRFMGNVPSGQVAEHLRQFDVLVCPSLTWQRGRTQWKEQFGRSLVEAMACGVPVIGSDSGEIPNVIAEAGLIAPEGDVAAVRAHLQRLMDSPGLRRELAHRGRQRTQEHYTQRRIAQQTFACYTQLLEDVDLGERQG